jgi:hypothetical protein
MKTEISRMKNLPDLVKDCKEDLGLYNKISEYDKVHMVIGEIKDSEERFGNVLSQIVQVRSFNHSHFRI